MIIEQIKTHLKDVNDFQSTESQEIQNFRQNYLGKKGILNSLFASFRDIPNEEKKEVGKWINDLKVAVNEKVDSLQNSVAPKTSNTKNDEDLSKTPFPFPVGARHPINIVIDKINTIFSRIGYSVVEGPEIEDDWHNFTALNFTENHPARDMQDTFFVEKDMNSLLRTHTSSVQIRHMKDNQPPMRILSPGRVFRNEAISARSHCIFHQIEGLYIDKNVSFADLKNTLQYFTKALFGKSKIRLRPSYFPFTEPSAEVDVYWGLETETDYKITKGTGWLEIIGCGMVDPNVLENCNIDPDKYSGFAFGMGIERIAMLLYQIPDIRMFYENDIRFLKQFSTEV